MGSVLGVAAADAVPDVALAVFRLFAATVSSDPPVVSSASASFVSAPLPPPSSAPPSLPLRFPPAATSAAPFAASPSRPFGAAPDDVFDAGYPDAVPQYPDAAVPAVVPDSFRAEFRWMLSYVIDLFPQSAGSPSVAPPPRALFEDFFGPALIPPQPIHFNWFERVHTALTDADARMASFLVSGRSAFSFLPSRAPAYAVHGEFAQINPSILSLFERPLCPHYKLGLTIREAAALESSFRAQPEALSHSMWILSGLLAFVRLQGFAPEDAVLFNTLVMSLSKCLAHQALISASHTAFIALKRRKFYLSHLPAYFSDVNKKAMLSSLAVCAGFLSLMSLFTRRYSSLFFTAVTTGPG